MHTVRFVQIVFLSHNTLHLLLQTKNLIINLGVGVRYLE